MVSLDQTILNRSRQQAVAPIQPSHISNEELQIIQHTLPSWLTEIEAKCASKWKVNVVFVKYETFSCLRYSWRNSACEKWIKTII